MKSNQQKAYICGISAVVIWSTVATAFKMALMHITPLQLLLIAVCVSTLFFIVVLTVQGKLTELFTVSRKDFFSCALLGIGSPFLYYFLLLKGYTLLPAQLAQPINYTWAIMIPLLSVPILKHRVLPLEWLAIGISYLGVVVIASKGGSFDFDTASLSGIGVILLTTVCWALYSIFSTRLAIDVTHVLALSFLCSLPWILAMNFYESGWNLFSILFASKEGLLYGVYVGLFEMGITFVLWFKAMRLTISVSRISNLMFFAPFLSLFFISMILGEDILFTTIIGLCLIVLGNAVQQYAVRKE